MLSRLMSLLAIIAIIAIIVGHYGKLCNYATHINTIYNKAHAIVIKNCKKLYVKVITIYNCIASDRRTISFVIYKFS